MLEIYFGPKMSKIWCLTTHEVGEQRIWVPSFRNLVNGETRDTERQQILFNSNLKELIKV